MKFPLYFAKKIAFSKDNKNNLSQTIIFIGRLSVILGVIVSLITLSTGFGSKKTIKEHMANFNGHITIKSMKSNTSYNSTPINQSFLKNRSFTENPQIASFQKFASVSGIFRTEKNFAGIIYKGVGRNFDKERFSKFIIEGKIPDFEGKAYTNDIIISEKIAKDLELKLQDSIISIFSKEDEQPLYRKFVVSAIYKTDIKIIDDLFVIGDIKHSLKILNLKKDDIGGIDVFLNDINHLDQDFPLIEKVIGIENYAEKATDIFPEIKDWIQIFDTNILLIISIMLVVVVINIIMVLLILIIERTNSIGMLKTLGATNFQIQSIFIYYTLLIMIPGLVIGNVIAIGFLLLQKFFGFIRLNPDNYFISQVPVDLNVLHILSISLGMLVISAIMLVIPSFLIGKISPIKAIKYN